MLNIVNRGLFVLRLISEQYTIPQVRVAITTARTTRTTIKRTYFFVSLLYFHEAVKARLTETEFFNTKRVLTRPPFRP